MLFEECIDGFFESDVWFKDLVCEFDVVGRTSLIDTKPSFNFFTLQIVRICKDFKSTSYVSPSLVKTGSLIIMCEIGQRNSSTN